MNFLVQLFAAFWGAFFEALLKNLPAISAWWKSISTTTISDAPPADPALVQDLNTQIDDAIKAGKIPAPGAKL